MTSTSYWHQTAPAIPLSTDLPHSVDVAVIGGGLMGVATKLLAGACRCLRRLTGGKGDRLGCNRTQWRLYGSWASRVL
jgi:hypothetical protein